jgi:putative FmdB family regulatory protein
MPVYEYKCEKCGHELEAEQRITEPPLKTCPRCRAKKLKRLISQTSFVLKGGGWYSDLYASKKSDGGEAKPEGAPAKSEGAEASSGASDPGSGGDGSPTDSKPKPKRDKRGKRKGSKAAA